MHTHQGYQPKKSTFHEPVPVAKRWQQMHQSTININSKNVLFNEDVNWSNN